MVTANPSVPFPVPSGVVRIEASPSPRSASRASEPAVVVDRLPNRMLLVELRDGVRIAVHASGAMRIAVIRLVAGDAVLVERSPYDAGKGRIVGLDPDFPSRDRAAPNEQRRPSIDRVEIQP